MIDICFGEAFPADLSLSFFGGKLIEPFLRYYMFLMYLFDSCVLTDCLDATEDVDIMM